MRFVRVFIYYLLGILLILYIGSSLFRSVTTVSVTTALVTSSVHVVEAQIDGTVKTVDVGPVESPTITMTSPELEMQIVQAKYELKEALLQLDVAKANSAKLSIYTDDLEQKHASLQALVTSSTQNVEACNDLLQRCRGLWKRGIINSNELMKCTALYHTQREELAKTKAELDDNVKAREWAKKGYLFSRARGDWGTLSVDQELTMASATVQAKHEKVKSLEELGELLTLSMPARGKVRMLVKPGHYVKAGEPVAIVEEDGERQVEAFVERSQLSKIGLAGRAKVLSDLSKTLNCEVSNVDFTPDIDRVRSIWSLGNLSRVEDGYVAVRLSLKDQKADQLVSGYPVTVQFPRRPIISWYKQKLLSKESAYSVASPGDRPR